MILTENYIRKMNIPVGTRIEIEFKDGENEMVYYRDVGKMLVSRGLVIFYDRKKRNSYLTDLNTRNRYALDCIKDIKILNKKIIRKP